jgi:fructose-1,6-bisphosphatase/sedoheptulose 1,7-bisphosphatase-like protein
MEFFLFGNDMIFFQLYKEQKRKEERTRKGEERGKTKKKVLGLDELVQSPSEFFFALYS